MKVLIAEDDLGSRKFLFKFLSAYGDCDITVDGAETLEAFLMAWEDGAPYDLICLDIMMPKLDGIKVMKAIREFELHKGIQDDKKTRIIMTTALNNQETVLESFEAGCQAYAAKPIDLEKMIEVMKKMALVD
ncbi:MAG: response regulator [Ignavibacteriales bacterium]